MTGLPTSVHRSVEAEPAMLLLTQLTETPDYDMALWKPLFDYLDLKVQALSTECQVFE